MNEVLIDAFRHHAWATKTLIGFCRDLTTEQLTATAPGAYGGLAETIDHLIGSDGWYRSLLAGEEPAWLDEDTLDLDELERRAEEMRVFWETWLSEPVDPEREIVDRTEDGRPQRIKVGMLIAQILNHGNDHRDQVCTILTAIGVSPPELDAWAYGYATGRVRIEPAPTV